MAPCSRAQLLRVWAAYLKHQKPYVKPSTFSQDYSSFTNRLENSPQWIETSDHVLEWLLQDYGHDVARRTLQQVKAAFKWAAGAKVARSDPFVAIANLPKLSRSNNAWRAFEPAERTAILNRFSTQLDGYRRWVTLMFLTGTRPQEARALQISSVSRDYRQLAITTAFRMGQPTPHGTKTGAITPDFPVNAQLEKLLRECIGDRRSGWLLPGPSGGPFSYGNFQAKVWYPTVNALADEGEIAWYLPQKHCRHTWITSMLAAGMDVETVAYLARNSPAVIYRHYAQRQKSPIIPDL